MKKKRRTYTGDLRLWLGLESFIITAASIGTYALVSAFVEHFWEGTPGSPVYAVGMLIPMGVVVGVLSYMFLNQFNWHLNGLTGGLKSVAEGDFTVRLDEKSGGPLSQAYADFNKMGEELQSIQTLRSDFINNFSHEFKTPVAAIGGFAELLLEPDVTEEERDEYCRLIAGESKRLAELADSTLLMAKVESQQIVVEKEWFSLDEQIKQCAILLAGSWEKKEIAFSASLEPVQYLGNEALIRHVWMNLMGNAVKYTPPGGQISIRLESSRPEKGEVRFSVTDTGIGMSPQVCGHIFDKYYQADPSRSDRGLGLGLSIASRITQLCGGRILVESQEGKGSTFTVILPVMEKKNRLRD